MTDDMRRLAMGWLRRADGVTVIGDQPITDPVHVTVIIATPRPSVHDETGGGETTMLTIDEIRIEGAEDGFHLVVYTDNEDSVRYRIGLPDQFRAEVERTIGNWLYEGEAARDKMPEDLRGPDLPLTDPRHPDYHDTMMWLWHGSPRATNPDLARDIERGK